MRRDRARMAVYALAGIYLLYLAWEIRKNLPTAGTEKPLMIVFMVLFAVIGIAAVANGIYSAWKQAKEMSEAAADPTPEEGGTKTASVETVSVENEMLSAEDADTVEKVEKEENR